MSFPLPSAPSSGQLRAHHFVGSPLLKAYQAGPLVQHELKGIEIYGTGGCRILVSLETILKAKSPSQILIQKDTMYYCFDIPAYSTSILNGRNRRHCGPPQNSSVLWFSPRYECHKTYIIWNICFVLYLKVNFWNYQKILVSIPLVEEQNSSILWIAPRHKYNYAQDFPRFCKQLETSHFAIYSLIWKSKQTKGGLYWIEEKAPREWECSLSQYSYLGTVNLPGAT